MAHDDERVAAPDCLRARAWIRGPASTTPSTGSASRAPVSCRGSRCPVITTTRDVMCEPGLGVPTLEEINDGLDALAAGTFVIVEHDLYPCDFARPYPIAARTRETLRAAGVG